MINIELTEAEIQEYAIFYGWTPEVETVDGEGNVTKAANPVTALAYATAKMLERARNDLREKKNRDAILALEQAETPVPEPVQEDSAGTEDQSPTSDEEALPQPGDEEEEPVEEPTPDEPQND